MPYDNWKQRIYDSYVSNGFGGSHDVKKYERQRRYFKKNYLRFMPQDKNIKILELGCGMGEFYYFCRREGYRNYCGIDVSKENISYIRDNLGKDAPVLLDNIFEYLGEMRMGGV